MHADMADCRRPHAQWACAEWAQTPSEKQAPALVAALLSVVSCWDTCMCQLSAPVDPGEPLLASTQRAACKHLEDGQHLPQRTPLPG